MTSRATKGMWLFPFLMCAWGVGFGLLIAKPEPRYTLITKERRADSAWLVEPIYPVTITLQPLNAVAKGTSQGEALRCTTSVEGDNIYFQCDDARFQLVGFSLQE